MRKKQNTSSLQLVNKRASMFSYSKFILASIFFAFNFAVIQTQDIPRNNPEIINTVKTVSINIPMNQDRIRYELQGNKVFVTYGKTSSFSTYNTDDIRLT